MKKALLLGVMSVCVAGVLLSVEAQSKDPSKRKGESVSFKNDVFPIVKKNCLPCHAEDNFNPSELALDNYETLMAGGKEGAPVVSGKSGESMLVKKLGEKPPFGDRMPLNTKKRIAAGQATWLTKEELNTIATWIDQGAKNN